MSDTSLEAYLVRVALDPEFRAVAIADPDRSFAGYELSDDEAASLRRRDNSVLELVGRVVRDQMGLDSLRPTARPDPPSAPAPEPEPARVAPPAGVALPEIGVMIRLAPYAEGTAGVDLQVSYAASLLSIPHPSLVDDVPLTRTAPSDHAVGAFDPERAAARDVADITIIGLGLSPDQLTREAERAIRSSREVLYLDTGVATGALLAGLASRATSLFAESYEEDAPRLDAYGHMVSRVIEAAVDHAPVVFAVHGHPLVGVTAPFEVARLAADRGLTVKVLPAVSAMDALFADIGVDPVVSGVQMYEATDLLLRRRPLHPDVAVLIWQVGNLETRLHSSSPSQPERFHRFRDYLLRFYPGDHPVTIYFASPHPLVATTNVQSTIAELADHAPLLHAGVTLYIPPAFDRPIVDGELLALVDDPAHLRAITR